MDMLLALSTSKPSSHEHRLYGNVWWWKAVSPFLVSENCDHDLLVIVIIAYSFLCLVSMAYGALEHFPFRNILTLFVSLLFLGLPLHTLGTILGRSLKGNPNNPCRVASLPSPIPPAAFYARPRFICLVSGLLPFGSIFIEIFFIFASIWSYKYYYVYGFLACMLCEEYNTE